MAESLQPITQGRSTGTERLREAWILFPAVGATILGIYLLSGLERDYLTGFLPWQKQALWALFGVVAALVAARIPPLFLVRISPFLYVANLVLLLVVLFIGTRKGGAVSWIWVGPFHFQPAEPMKLVTVLFLARILRCGRGDRIGFQRFSAAVASAATPSVLIAVQPDLGSALIFPAILVASLYGARVPRRYLTLILSPLWALLILPGDPLLWITWAAGVSLWMLGLVFRGEDRPRLFLFFCFQVVLAAGIGWGVKPAWEHLLKPHQRDRLVGFLERDEKDIRKLSPAAYHLRQSLIAISSGGLLGQGRGQGMQSTHGFIPMMRTDFIFSVVAEELGFVGSIVLFSFFALLLMRTARCAAQAETWTESTVAFGILGLWSAHIFINLGMTMGLSPITGIPLPFVSYGGSSILSNFLALGMVLSLSKRSSELPHITL